MNIFETENLYYLGPEGTYAQFAMKQFQKSLQIKAKKTLPVKPITNIIRSVIENPSDMAVLPIENSIEGIVRETIDNLIQVTDKGLKITAEIIIPINHCLISKATNIKDVKHIISHPQALGQCSGYICRNLNGTDVLEASSTSDAAFSASKKGAEYAAIASEFASEIYGLNILDKNINDETDNKTRFILISKYQQNKIDKCKTSLFFIVKNEPGSLVNVLNIFHKYSINLLYIESRPSKKKMGEYNFCVDLEGHISDENVAAAINLTEKAVKKLIVLGSYPIDESLNK